MDAIVRLREENDLLRERVRQLESALIPPTAAPDGCHLTPSELIIFRHLSLGRLSSREAIRGFLYSDRLDEPESGYIVDVFIAYLRRKLGPHGFVIETVWGQGWKMISKHAEAA